MGFEVRLAVLEDASEIARLSAELGYPCAEAEFSARLAALLPLATQFIAVAAAEGRLLGWIAAERRMLLVCGERAEIVGLVVDASSRRSGVGGALAAAAETWARSKGFDLVTVRSNVARPESHPFYERIGYTRAKTQHAYTKQLP